MRKVVSHTFAVVAVCVFPALVSAQPTAEQKKATAEWITKLQDAQGGFYLAPQPPDIDAMPRPSLRATNGAVRALKYLGAEIPNADKHAAFVLKCFDAKTGGFAEPGGKPDVTITSIGVMAAVELKIPKAKFAKAMDYLKDNAKTFEEVRIGAAAVEAWGVKDCPFKLEPWLDIVKDSDEIKKFPILNSLNKDDARDIGSVAAFVVRLEFFPSKAMKEALPELKDSQRDDGAWGKKGEKTSDIETTYRVMRALMLLKEKPKDTKKLRAFIDSHRNKDGGYATKSGDKSSMSGVYYCVIVSKWLDDMEKK
jgi:hypothetical protein